MNVWTIVGISLAVLLLIFVVIKKRKKGKGLKKYREDVKFSVKPATEKIEKTKLKTHVAYFHFDGDMKASSRKNLSQFIDEILHNKDLWAEVVILVESPGGAVSHYGVCMSEMERIRNAGIPLTVCVDIVAASGGYLMSLPANKILAAPFAMIGSIGVMSFIPNFRKLLKRLDITPRTFTAGKFKRTVTLTDDAGPEETAHYQAKLESIHYYFSSAVKKYRPAIDVDKVCTGDYWLAKECMDQNLHLIDGIKTSSDYLMELNRDHHLVSLKAKKGLKMALGKFGMRLMERLFWNFG